MNRINPRILSSTLATPITVKSQPTILLRIFTELSSLPAKTSYQKMMPFVLGSNDLASLLVETDLSGTDVDRSVKRWLVVIRNSIVIMSFLSKAVSVHLDKLTIMVSVLTRVYVRIWCVDRSSSEVHQSFWAPMSTWELLTCQNNLFSNSTFSLHTKLNY